MIINFIDKVKLVFKKDHELAFSLQKMLGFYPHKLEYYRVALAHKSLIYRNAKGHPTNNERLEYLGDAILEAVVSDIVFHRYPNRREGFLTSTRSKIVQRSSLNHLASEMGLNRLIKTSGSSHTHNNNIGGNAFEALVGAIYLDRGYAVCKWFVEKRIMGRLLDIDGVAKKEVNFKSKLLEWTQKNRIQSHYAFVEREDDNSNSPIFSSTITIEGLLAGKGTGYSKKESQQAAAKDALTKLRRNPKFADSIFRAKEKRTAMEADEICALPKIEEIEEEIAKSQRAKTPTPSTSRHAKRAPRQKVNNSVEEPNSDKAITQEKTAKASNAAQEVIASEEVQHKADSTANAPTTTRRRRTPQRRTTSETPAASTEPANTVSTNPPNEVTENQQTEADATQQSTKRPRRQRSTSASSNQRNKGGQRPSDAEREAIISKAEATAFEDGNA